MARKVIPGSAEHPFVIQVRSLDRNWFNLPLECIWSVFEDYLFLTKYEFNLQIHAFVLLPDSFKLIVTAPNNNLGKALLYFMRESSREIGRLAGRINQSFGHQNRKTLILDKLSFMNCYKFIYRCPVRDGLVQRVEDYKFSTLNGLLGQTKLIIPVEADSQLFSPEFEMQTLNWLNADPIPIEDEDIGKALRRSIFSLPRDRTKKTPNRLYQKLL